MLRHFPAKYGVIWLKTIVSQYAQRSAPGSMKKNINQYAKRFSIFFTPSKFFFVCVAFWFVDACNIK